MGKKVKHSCHVINSPIQEPHPGSSLRSPEVKEEKCQSPYYLLFETGNLYYSLFPLIIIIIIIIC